MKKKLSKAFSAPRDLTNNGVIPFIEFVLLPAGVLKYGHPEFRVERTRDGLEPLVYTDARQLEQDYLNDVVGVHTGPSPQCGPTIDC